ncbi:hypothetical protein BGZ92_009833, partial [Podila epicladia]
CDLLQSDELLHPEPAYSIKERPFSTISSTSSFLTSSPPPTRPPPPPPRPPVSPITSLRLSSIESPLPSASSTSSFAFHSSVSPHLPQLESTHGKSPPTQIPGTSVKQRSIDKGIPLPSLSDDSSSESDLPQETHLSTPNQPHRRGTHRRSSTLTYPSYLETTSRMQQVELMTDAASGLPPGLYDSDSRSVSISPSSNHLSSSSQRLSLSAKRMRPPLAEISTATMHPAPTTLISTSSSQTRHLTNFEKGGSNAQLQGHTSQGHSLNAPMSTSTASVSSSSTSPTILSTQKIRARRMASRGRLSRDAKAIKIRIRRLWQDPRQPELSQSRHGSKNEYVLLEESLTGILQIVPLIIQNAKAPSDNLIAPNLENSTAAPHYVTPHSSPLEHSPRLSLSYASHAPSKSSKSSGSNPTTPLRTRARTTSSNSSSTIGATRYLIATSILQPPEPPLTDLGQPTLRSPTSIATLGEPALSTIALGTSPANNVASHLIENKGPLLSESSEILISKLLSLSNTFTGAIRTLCEQQNEKVLRFDDDMILELLTRWEQEAGKEDEHGPDNSSSTSLVTLGTTNALERYQITVSRVWEETEVILASIRKIRDLVEFGRVQNYSDFDPDDSEEEVIKKDEVVRQISMAEFIADEPRPIKILDRNLARKLKRKTKFKTIADKVRRSFTDFAKRSTTSLLTIFPPLGDGTNDGFLDMFSDGDYDSEYVAGTDMTESIYDDDDTYSRTISPPASPGGISDRYRQRHRRLSSKDSSGPPEQYWPGSIKLGSSDDNQSPVKMASGMILGPHSMATSMSRSMSSERTTDNISTRFNLGSPTGASSRHSLDSLRESHETFASLPVHTFDAQVPPLSTLKPGTSEKRQSLLFRRRNSVQSGFTGASISAPLPSTARPFSAYTSASEIQPLPTKHNYRVKPPKPPCSLPTLPSSPTEHPDNAEFSSQDSSSSFKQKAANRTSSYLAARSTPPQVQAPLILDSPFTRQTSIRMANDRNRYSIKMPSDDVPESVAPTLFRNGSRQTNLRNSMRTMSLEKAHRRHSSPLIFGAETVLSDALHRRSSTSSQHSTVSSSLSSNRDSVQMMATVKEYSKARQLQREQGQRGMSTNDVASRPSADFIETEALRIPPLSRPANLGHLQGQSNGHSNNFGSDKDRDDTAHATSQASTGPAPRPQPHPRIGDMKKAWEILNLDVKRLNPYSHMRAYARPYTAQSNLWALSHPNALPSSTSPRVLHICENGADVLVMEMFAGHLQVVAGQLEKLIERLADENAQDTEYVNCFLLSHSFFINSEDLLERLIARFHIQPRQGEILYFEKWQTVIQVKVLCVFQRWIQIQYEDFELNPNLLKALKNFLEVDVRMSGFAMEGECIEKNISIKSLSPLKNCSVIMEQGRFCLQRSRTRKISLSRSQKGGISSHPPPSPSATPSRLDVLPSTPSSFNAPLEQMIEIGPAPELTTSPPILQLNARDLARYLTLADMKAFRSITVFELMSGWWKRRQAQENKTADEKAEMNPKAMPNLGMIDIDGVEDGAIEAFTRRANMLSYWVAHEIVSTAGVKTRKQLLKKFIEVARICRSLNNLHTAMFILSALSSTPVRRLHASWKLVSARDMETLEELEQLLDISGNMRCYRQAIAEATAPAIPFLPILLKDITFILDGNPTMIASKVATSTSPTSNGTQLPQQPNVPQAPSVAGNETSSGSGTAAGTVQLVNFDKFRQLTQYVENAVDLARSVDYSFEHQLLRQARVFRPSSPSLYGSTDIDSQLASNAGSVSNNIVPVARRESQPDTSITSGALDHISELVERRLVKASGLYGVQQRVIEVEFSTRTKAANSLWKGNSSTHGSNYSPAETVIRSVQGEEEYLMGLSLMCEPSR